MNFSAPSVCVETERVTAQKADELLEADPLASSHLIFEELRRRGIGRALFGCSLGRKELTEEDVDSVVMPVLDELNFLIYLIENRKNRRQRSTGFSPPTTGNDLICSCFTPKYLSPIQLDSLKRHANLPGRL